MLTGGAEPARQRVRWPKPVALRFRDATRGQRSIGGAVIGAEDLLICPICHGPLARITDGSAGTAPTCSNCGRRYVQRDGFMDMTPQPVPDPDVKEMWPLWEQLQDNAVIAYEADPVANLSVGPRRDARLFAEFSQVTGLTLDIGCGPQAAPSYGLDAAARLVGLDPLAGVQPRSFDFVQGIGEYLPFASGTFDTILLATSLDHMLVPTRVLDEARRVLKPSGKVSIWFEQDHHRHGSANSEMRRRARAAVRLVRERDLAALTQRMARKLTSRGRPQTPTYMSSIAVPDGAKDHFHAFHLSSEIVEGWLRQVGLVKKAQIEDEEAGCFMLATTEGA